MTLHFCTRMPSAGNKIRGLYSSCKIGTFFFGKNARPGKRRTRPIFRFERRSARARARARVHACTSVTSFFVPFSTLHNIQPRWNTSNTSPAGWISINANIRDARNAPAFKHHRSVPRSNAGDALPLLPETLYALRACIRMRSNIGRHVSPNLVRNICARLHAYRSYSSLRRKPVVKVNASSEAEREISFLPLYLFSLLSLSLFFVSGSPLEKS